MQMVGGSSSVPKEGSPSFFKVVRYPSAPHLLLPTAFVRKHLHKIPENPTLKTATGEHSWRLKIQKIGEDYGFSHGWDQLVQDAQLSATDVLVFWLIDPFTFQVSFFDVHGCEKDLPLNNTGDGDDDGDGEDENLCFEKVISEKTHRYAMALPRKFVVDAGLEYEKSIMVKDYEGKEWIMGLMAERYHRTKHSLSAGWSVFRKYYKLSDGDICLFKFIKKEGVLILTKLLKSKRKTPNVDVKIEQPSRGGGVDVKIEDESSPEEVVKRKRGLPPVEKVKIEEELCGEVEVVRGRPPPPPCGGGVEVKIEDGASAEVVAVKKKRASPPLEKADGGGGVEVKIEAETEVVVQRKTGSPLLEAETERLIRIKDVIYF